MKQGVVIHEMTEDRMLVEDETSIFEYDMNCIKEKEKQKKAEMEYKQKKVD